MAEGRISHTSIGLTCYEQPIFEVKLVTERTVMLTIRVKATSDPLLMILDPRVDVTLTFADSSDLERFLETMAEVGNSAYVQHLVNAQKGDSDDAGGDGGKSSG